MTTWVVPDSIEPLIGWRAFLLEDDRLLSPMWRWPKQHWRPGPNHAICQLDKGLLPRILGYRHPHGASVPASECSCGLYAFHSLDLAKARFSSEKLRLGQRMVYALVKSQGDIEVHQQGFRAGEMELVALVGHSLVEDQLLQGAAAYYQVPVLAPEVAEIELNDHGSLAEESLLPQEHFPAFERPKWRITLWMTAIFLLLMVAASVTFRLTLQGSWMALLPGLTLLVLFAGFDKLLHRDYREDDDPPTAASG